MKRIEPAESALTGITIVPVIGVAMMLLVVLLVISPVINLPNLPVDLPEAKTRETKAENITVSMGSDGQISVELEIVEWADLGPKLRAALHSREDAVVILRADKDLPYGSVEKLVRTVNQHIGRRPLALATRQRATLELVGEEL